MKVFIGKYPKSEKKERIVRVRIDDSDVWSADTTLALIISPLLKKFKSNMHSTHHVYDADVPENLRVGDEEAHLISDDDFEKNSLKWNYVIDEMIWTFDQISGYVEEPSFFDDKHIFDSVGHKEYCDRLANGTRLFGKYYQALWD